MSQPEDLLLELVRVLHRRMLECVLPVAREHELSNVALLLLRQIQSSPGGTVSDLARKTEIAKSHVSNTVDLLDRQGFVEKRADAEDRRLLHLFPTAKAQAIGRAIVAEARRSVRQALEQVPPDTLDALLEGMRTVISAFEHRVFLTNEPARESAQSPGYHDRR